MTTNPTDSREARYIACEKCGSFPNAAIAKRLRRVCRMVGLENAVPETDEALYGVMFSVLGMIARKLETAQSAKAEPVEGPKTAGECYDCFTDAACVHTTPMPQPQACKVPEPSDDDMRWLRRFDEICNDCDAGGHDLPKSAVRDLEKLGALRSLGFGRHETTEFGEYLLAKGIATQENYRQQQSSD